MPDKLKPNSKAFRKRQAVWRHNGFFGTVSFARQGLLAIINSDTAKPTAKTMAKSIINDLGLLEKLLKDRVDAN